LPELAHRLRELHVDRQVGRGELETAAERLLPGRAGHLDALLVGGRVALEEGADGLEPRHAAATAAAPNKGKRGKGGRQDHETRTHDPLFGGPLRLPPGGGAEGAHGYDESVSQLTPQQEPDYPLFEPQPEPERGYEPLHPEPRWKEVGRKLLAPLIAVGALLAKFKAIALALFKFKLFATSGTMLVSIAAYAWIWGWKFGVGFVLLIFVHELGHVLELRRQGVPASAPLFIPFLGAVVGMKQMPEDAWKESRVALAGPLLGSAGAAGVWAVGEALDSNLLVALAFTGFFLNLFNLLPIVPLDGGRAVAAIHPGLWGVGLAGLVALALWHPNPVLILILLLGGFELWRRWRERGTPQAASYYKVKTWQRLTAGAVYLGLAAALAVAMTATHLERTF
jgi:Zn-dependent protease